MIIQSIKETIANVSLQKPRVRSILNSEPYR